jgi:hypothetical protein
MNPLESGEARHYRRELPKGPTVLERATTET